jgi:lysocardiolipin and lysophospholipid acyltransferase
MAYTKKLFGIQITTMTKWWSPTVIRVSGDESVRGQIRQSKDGNLECDFPERMVLIANHQVGNHLVLAWESYC